MCQNCNFFVSSRIHQPERGNLRGENVQVANVEIPTSHDQWLESNQCTLHGYCCRLHPILHFLPSHSVSRN